MFSILTENILYGIVCKSYLSLNQHQQKKLTTPVALSYHVNIVSDSAYTLMSKVVSTRLSEETETRLQRLARRLGKTPSETGAMLIEESLRENEFAYIEFRNSPVGRQAYMKSSTLAVWQVIMLAEQYQHDVKKVVTHLQKPIEWVKAAFNYAEAYPEEISLAIEDDRAINYTTIKRILPQTELLLIPQDVLQEGSQE
ncbi:MAG: transcriptional regulator [Xenococcaceae cyanobacterium MO_188.B32]|nr:transcriptional regulator [Xenococcaceae cyanobacterium MO_188.B32]